MTEQSGHNDKFVSDTKRMLKHFDPEERKKVQTIWKASMKATPELPAVTENEVEEALSEVHRKIASSHHTSPSVSDRTIWWRRLTAAAVLLLVLGAGFFMVPRTVTAPPGEIVTTELPDGSEVELNSGTQIQYNRLFGLTNRVIELEGEAFFIVQEGDIPFVVTTHNSTVQVTGTQFNVRAWTENPDKETEVAVSEGSVLFYPADRIEQAVTLTPGQWSRWTAGMEQPTVPETTELNRLLGWREHKLMFNNKSLTVIFNELERRFDVQIRISDTTIARETLTTYYANPKGAESVIRDICRVKGLRYSKTANGFRVYR